MSGFFTLFNPSYYAKQTCAVYCEYQSIIAIDTFHHMGLESFLKDGYHHRLDDKLDLAEDMLHRSAWNWDKSNKAICSEKEICSLLHASFSFVAVAGSEKALGAWGSGQ